MGAPTSRLLRAGQGGHQLQALEGPWRTAGSSCLSRRDTQKIEGASALYAVAARAAAHHRQSVHQGSGCQPAASATLLLFRSTGQHTGTCTSSKAPWLRPSGRSTGTGMGSGRAFQSLLHRRSSFCWAEGAVRRAGFLDPPICDRPITRVDPSKFG